MNNRRFHSTGKGNSAPLPAGQGQAAAVFGKIILAGGSGISPKNPAQPGARTFWSLWNKIPGSASITVMKKIMDLNQAEVAVTTQHLIDIRQERDSLLRMSDFGDMGEFLCTCSELFPEEETPEYRYTKWEEIPDPLINREWLCPNFFDIRGGNGAAGGTRQTDFFFDWCDRYGHDISTEDPHLLIAHYRNCSGT